LVILILFLQLSKYKRQLKKVAIKWQRTIISCLYSFNSYFFSFLISI